MKVTGLYGHDNDLYEAAIRSHGEHDRLHGYEMKVLREKIVNGHWSKPAYLLSLLVQELAKAEEDRAEWMMWLGPDIILLNPQIPLEIFLPPEDFKHTNFIGTHDPEGLNGGAFFLRVDDWSVQMLVEVLAPPREPGVDIAQWKDAKALENVLASEQFRDAVVYQPRMWFNAYQLDAERFEGKRGDLLVHFHDLEGDKWSAMQQTLNKLSDRKINSTWSVPLRETTYEREVLEFWDRLRKSKKLLELAAKKTGEYQVDKARDKLSWVKDYQCDREDVMHSAMDEMKSALGMAEGEKVT